MATRDPYGLGLEAEVNRLSDYDPLWPRAFAEEADRIKTALGPVVIAIEHYGSTAVPGLRAKPIIDMLIGVAEIDQGLSMIESMAHLGYDYAGSQGIPEHHIFGRGAVRTHLAHVVVHGGAQWKSCLGFRDRLRADPVTRARYLALKEQLAAEAPTRAAYTAGKSEFVLANSG
ncbi:MAG TPA: GrpB family protein [Caulobacteraceae bacterium]|jgi:GrpB-like predicted nucleotidyltransferase (UPF0157 family)